MHAGSIHRAGTGAARVYRVLSARRGQWVGGWELTLAASTSAVSTRVSEVRRQLEDGEVIDVEKRGVRFYYRLREGREQLELVM